jgi:PAS domain S-box-containing protein
VAGLDNQQRAKAWVARFHTSFEGVAIVNRDLTFRSVSKQFCDILGVTPADLLDNKFTDMTPEPDKTLDLRNAKAVISGKSQRYFIPKTYQINGKLMKVLLLVDGVYKDSGDFDFFVSRIVAAPEESLSGKSLSPASSLVAEVKRHGLGAGIAFLAWVAWEVIKLAKNGPQ